MYSTYVLSPHADSLASTTKIYYSSSSFMAFVKLQRSLNPEAPEFLPNRNRNSPVDEVPYFTSHLPTQSNFSSPNGSDPYFHQYHNPPSPYFQAYTTLLLYPEPSYTNTYLTHNVTQLHDSFQAPGVATSIEPVPLWVIPDEETCMTGEATVEEPEPVVQKGYQRGAAKRGYKNRFFWRQGFKGLDSQADNQKWRRKSNNGEYRRHRHNEDMFRYARNVQYRAAPPKQRHLVLPVENDGRNTTVMIRNIPNKFTRNMLMNFLDDHCMAENQKAEVQNSVAAEEELPAIVSAFDFLYLPIDFQNHVNKGYAFVNFTNPRAVWKFYLASHNKPWGAFQSNKIREIACARLQGKDELVRHFEKIDFPCEEEEYLPVCFTPARDGSREKVNQRTVGRCACRRTYTKPNQAES